MTDTPMPKPPPKPDPEERTPFAWLSPTNDQRGSKMRTLTMPDEVWDKLTELAGPRGRSRFVQALILAAWHAREHGPDGKIEP